MQPAAQIERGERDLVPREPDVGIEIEHHQVRLLRRVGVRAPRVDLERAELRERDEPRHVVDLHVVDDLAVVLRRSAPVRPPSGEPASRCFWKKHGLPWCALPSCLRDSARA